MRLTWLEGEQAAFAGKPGRLSGAAEERAFEQLLDALDKRQPLRAADVARLGDEKLADLALELTPTTCNVATLKMLLGRLGERVLEQAVSFVRSTPDLLLEAAMPIEAPELVHAAATLLFEQRLPSDDEMQHVAPSSAESWLLRHRDFAAKVLEPLAKQKLRDAFGCALAFLAANGVATSQDWLAPIASLAPIVAREPALALLVARDQNERVIARVGAEDAARAYVEHVSPKASAAALAMPAFFRVNELPRPTLKEGGAPLSDDEVRSLGALLRSSSLSHPDPEIAKLRYRCDRASLDAFAVALLDAWCDSTNERQSAWPLEACAVIGGDAAAREVAKRVRAWSRSRAYYEEEWAKLGCSVLAVLAQHGSEIARVLLDEIGRAGGRMRKEAKRLSGVVDVTSQEEAKIPTLGLDADGSATFELGNDTYRVVFDEGLAPHLVDASGARLAAFPRLRKGMDEKAWEAAKARYTGMVKDAKTVARHELALLERAMCEEEATPLATFRERFVDHPLMRHLGARLVWSSRVTFRVTEDGTFADMDDKALALDDDADVRLAHPALMTEDEKKAWMDRFADYEIVQPFPQLGRETFAKSPERTLDALRDGTTTRGRIFQLVSRGWELKYDRLERALPDGASARIFLTAPVGAWSEDYTIGSATCTERLDLLPAVAYSELIRDTEYLVTRRSPSTS